MIEKHRSILCKALSPKSVLTNEELHERLANLPKEEGEGD
jgi:hypothetical protein